MRIGMAIVRTLTLAAVVLMACAAHAGTPVAGFTDDLAADGLSDPTALAFLPDGRMLVTEKGGGLKLVTNGVPASAGNVPVCTDSEMGLLGIALDPGFATNGVLYLYRTAGAGDCGNPASRKNQVVRTILTDGQIGTLDPILTGIRTDNGNHDGGALRIGPDGKLYVGVGDTGVGDGGPPGTSTNPYAQDLGELEGKILRLELNGAVPADNPFVSTVGARGEIFAYGLRNPFRFGFDPFTGTLWAGDVGQETLEEIDRVVQGGNYGWPQCEGSLPNGCAQAGEIPPVYEYMHNGANASVTGGAFAVGGTAAGEYYFGEFIAGEIWRATLDVAREQFVGSPDRIVTQAAGPVDFVFGPDGALYYVAYFSGEVRRLGSPGFASSSTTTTISTTTTTSTLPPACGDAPTFTCTRAGIDTLATAVAALGDLGRLDERLAAQLLRARTAVDAAEERSAAGRHGAARAALRRALRALKAFRARLTSAAGQHRIELPTRSVLSDRIDDALAAVRTLRGTS